MGISEFRVFRETDNRAKDGKLIDAYQDEVRVLRTELRRLRDRIAELEARA